MLLTRFKLGSLSSLTMSTSIIFLKLKTLLRFYKNSFSINSSRQFDFFQFIFADAANCRSSLDQVTLANGSMCQTGAAEKSATTVRTKNRQRESEREKVLLAKKWQVREKKMRTTFGSNRFSLFCIFSTTGGNL